MPDRFKSYQVMAVQGSPQVNKSYNVTWQKYSSDVRQEMNSFIECAVMRIFPNIPGTEMFAAMYSNPKKADTRKNELLKKLIPKCQIGCSTHDVYKAIRD